MKKWVFVLSALSAYGTDCVISDVVRTPFGGYFAGKITVTLASPSLAQPLYSGSQTLTGWQTTIDVPASANGAVAVTLVCTDSITPSGTSYSARYQPTSGAGWAETWTPATGTTTIRAMRATTVPSPTVTFQPSQLALAAGSLIYGSSAGVGTSLTAGTNGHILTLSGGYPTWAADTSGVTGITGTANQITASASTGAVTLSLPATITGLTSVTSTGFIGALTGNASTATALASSVTSGRLWIGNGTGVPTSSATICGDVANGRIGVGTCSPARPLDVQGGGSGAGTMQVANGSTGGYSAIDGNDSSGTLQWTIGYGNSAASSFASQVFLGSRSSAPLVFVQNTTERFRLATSTGNLLIGGTTDGNYKLDVQSKGTTGAFRVFDQTATSGSTLVVIQAGQGQSGNLMSVRNYAGAEIAYVTSAGNFYATSRFETLGDVYLGGALQIDAPASGVMRLRDNAGTSFNRLQFGGTTSSFPALKRSTTILQARLADDSAYTDVGLNALIVNKAAPSASSDACTAGQMWAGDMGGTKYTFYCVASGTIVRSAFVSF